MKYISGYNYYNLITYSNFNKTVIIITVFTSIRHITQDDIDIENYNLSYIKIFVFFSSMR